MARYCIFIVSVCFVLGIVSQFFESAIFGITVAASIIAFLVFACGEATFSKKVVTLSLFSLAVGASRMQVFSSFQIDRTFDDPVSRTGITCSVASLPVAGERDVQAKLDCGGALVLGRFAQYTDVAYGDEMIVDGVPKRTDKGSLMAKYVFYEMSVSSSTTVSRNKGNFFLKRLYGLRVGIRRTMAGIFGSPHAELMTGLLVEGGDLISKDLKDEFRRVGLSHIIALSGFNVAVIVESFAFAMQGMRRAFRFTGIFVFILAFAFMVGFSSTIARAFIMACISLGADIFRKTYEPLRALCLSAVIMSLVYPLGIIYDISFQLSFMATLSMIVVSPLISGWFAKLPLAEMFRETLVSSMSALVLTTPIILFYTGNFSVVALLANMLVVPLLPITMLLGFIPVFFFFVPMLASLVSFPAYVLLSYILAVTHVGASLPFASVQMKMSIGAVFVSYAAVGFALWLGYKKTGAWPVS